MRLSFPPFLYLTRLALVVAALYLLARLSLGWTDRQRPTGSWVVTALDQPVEEESWWAERRGVRAALGGQAAGSLGAARQPPDPSLCSGMTWPWPGGVPRA